MKKLPPVEKVFEAWTAIADGHVSLFEDHADVSSSDDTKQYIVRFKGNLYSSDDNATYWRGYTGYPVLAVLMLQGRLPFDKTLAEQWHNVNWKEINTRFRNNYVQATEEVARERDINLSSSYEAAEKVINTLKLLDIEVKRKI